MPTSYLIGPTGVGKTAIGQRLQALGAVRYVDLDDVLAAGLQGAELVRAVQDWGAVESALDDLDRSSGPEIVLVGIGAGTQDRDRHFGDGLLGRWLLDRSERVALLMASDPVLRARRTSRGSPYDEELERSTARAIVQGSASVVIDVSGSDVDAEARKVASWLAEPAGAHDGQQTAQVAVVVPALRRPWNVSRFVTSLRASTPLARAYFVCDEDDLEEQRAVEESGAMVVVHESPRRTFAVKANFGYRHSTEPWVMLVGDDVRFRSGWLEAALEAAGDEFHLVGTNDLAGRDLSQLAVHPVFRRAWLDAHGASWDGPGFVAHEGYLHCFVDNEWTAVAKRAGAFVSAPSSVVEHLHPHHGAGAKDPTYHRGYRAFGRDRRLWERRAAHYTSQAASTGAGRPLR